MQILRMTACCVLGMSGVIATAQMAATSAATPAVGSIATPAAALDSQLSLIEMEMMGAVKAMPAEKFGFAPSAAIFVPSQKTEFATVRTFAQQAAHVAEANYYFSALVSGQAPDSKLRAVEKLTGKDEVVAALADSFAAAHKAFATLTVANAFEVIKSPEPGFATRSTLAGFLVSHANDHYGQMVEYLRMNAVIPPASAK
jgi:uncharacterized damage-inducible protein DinB